MSVIAPGNRAKPKWAVGSGMRHGEACYCFIEALFCRRRSPEALRFSPPSLRTHRETRALDVDQGELLRLRDLPGSHRPSRYRRQPSGVGHATEGSTNRESPKSHKKPKPTTVHDCHHTKAAEDTRGASRGHRNGNEYRCAYPSEGLLASRKLPSLPCHAETAIPLTRQSPCGADPSHFGNRSCGTSDAAERAPESFLSTAKFYEREYTWRTDAHRTCRNP